MVVGEVAGRTLVDGRETVRGTTRGARSRLHRRAGRAGLAAGALALALPLAADAAIFRVGNGTGCSGVTLATALLGAALNGAEADSIYMTITPSQTVPSEVELPLDGVGNLEIVGGFANCTDALPGAAKTNMTLPSSNGFDVVGGAAVTRFFTLANVSWIASEDVGRPLDLSGRVVATLQDVLLSNGAEDEGGNIRMIGDQVVLQLIGDTTIYLGESLGDGGGIHCSGGGAISLDDDARVTHNHAGGSGGGIHLSDCTLSVYTGSALPADCGSFANLAGVACNSADGSGGGVSAEGGAAVGFYGTSERPASLELNSAVQGGGIYLTGTGTSAEFVNAEIRDNSGSFEGGGAYVRSGAELSMFVDVGLCSRGPLCSLLELNRAAGGGGQGGALAVDSGGYAAIARTTIRYNNALLRGSAVFVEDNGSQVDLESVISHGHAGSLNEAYYQSEDLAALTVQFGTFHEATGCCQALFDTGNSSRVEVLSSILLGRVFEEPVVGGETRFLDCVLVDEIASLPGGISGLELIGSPSSLFAGYGALDYRLREGSQAIDFCDDLEISTPGGDIEYQPQGYNVPTVPNNPFGPFDLGADEWRPLFTCAFEPATACDAIGDWSAHVP